LTDTTKQIYRDIKLEKIFNKLWAKIITTF
jgi:hypothetical protein